MVDPPHDGQGESAAGLAGLSASRYGFLALGGIGLLAGLTGAMVLLGVPMPAPTHGLGADHGVLMTLGFLGLCLAAVWWIFKTGWKLKT